MDTFTINDMPRTWIFDLDGTLIEHLGYKLLPGVPEFLKANVRDIDIVVIMTARSPEHREETTELLNKLGIRFNQMVMGVGVGPRILVNDDKPFGYNRATAYAMRVERNKGMNESHINFAKTYLEE